VCFEGEAICTFCPWNSIELHVEARFSLRTKANAAQAHESQESAPRAGRATRIATDSYDEETSFSELEYSFAWSPSFTRKRKDKTMNTPLTSDLKAPLLLDRPYFVGLTTPGYPEFLKALVRLIANATKRGLRGGWVALKNMVLRLNQKLLDGAEIHERQTRMTEERYAKNFHHLRFLL
jgi:hypothetical protein